MQNIPPLLIPYTFWYKNWIHPEDWKKHKEKEAFETFLIRVLGSKAYEKRNQMRAMESAVSHVVNEIMMSRDALPL